MLPMSPLAARTELFFSTLRIGTDIPDRIRGMVRGVAIGDALGLPVECLSADEITAKHGYVTWYLPPSLHSDFRGAPAGTCSDDLQLTRAVMRAFTSARGFNYEALIKEHTRELGISTAGWGTTTKQAVERLANGVSWELSGVPENLRYGQGNGVLMKLAPLAALCLVERWEPGTAKERILHFTQMTHATPEAIAASGAYAFALLYCLSRSPHQFDGGEFAAAAQLGAEWMQESLGVKKPVSLLLNSLQAFSTLDLPELARACGGGTSFVGHSLPLSLTLFMRKPQSFDALLDAVNAGGDTDSNASLVGALLGALHGCSIFPQRYLDALHGRDVVEGEISTFLDTILKRG